MADKVGLPLHNIPSPFLSVKDIFFVVVDPPLLRVAVEGSDNLISYGSPAKRSSTWLAEAPPSWETSRGTICCLRYISRVQNGSPGSTRIYGPVHLRRYWSVPVSTGPYILGRPVKFSNSQDADNLHTIRKRMPIPFQ